jgi:hypothetical protein
VQANIRQIDGRRTDVVTAVVQAKLRPDVAVDAVTAPERSKKGVPVQISALVKELNGDVDAQADCVLSIDGVDVDQAAGIWVAAGDAVSCAFAYAFPQDGLHQITVAASHVVPGDYDEANNAASTSIQIVTEQFKNITANFRRGDYTSTQTGNYEYWDCWWDCYDYYWGGTDNSHQVSDEVHASATAETAFAAPFSELSARVLVDGNQATQLVYTNLAFDWVDASNPAYGCTWRSSTDANGRNHNLNVCTGNSGSGEWTNVWYNSYGGAATYYSSRWEYYYYYSYYWGGWYYYGPYWTYNYSTTWTTGNPASLLPVGQTYSVSLKLNSASATADMTTSTYVAYDYPYSYSDWYGYYYGENRDVETVGSASVNLP